MPFSRGSFQLRDGTQVPCIVGHQGNPHLTLVLSFSSSLRMLKVENNDDAELKCHFFIALDHEIQKYLTLTLSSILLFQQSH